MKAQHKTLSQRHKDTTTRNSRRVVCFTWLNSVHDAVAAAAAALARKRIHIAESMNPALIIICARCCAVLCRGVFSMCVVVYKEISKETGMRL